MADSVGVRRGFVMLTALWVIAVAGALALATERAGRNGLHAARNRIGLEQAQWLALGCAARARSIVDDALSTAADDADAKNVWRLLDRHLGGTEVDSACHVQLNAAGTQLDINAASSEMLAALLHDAATTSDPTALAAALEDWRDTDDVAVAGGAERDWYVANRRFPPRNGPLADMRELPRVRGFESLALAGVLSVEPGRVSLATAPVAVLMAVPGIGAEAAARIIELRDAGTPVNDLADIVGTLSDDATTEFLARYADAARLVTPDPDAWILTATARVGFPSSAATVEWRLVRVGRATMVVRARSDS